MLKRAISLLFIVLAGIWVVLSVIWVSQMYSQAGTLTKWLFPILMVINVAILLGLGFAFYKEIPQAHLAGIAYLVFSIILTITDEFGLADLVVLILYLLTLMLTLHDWYRVIKTNS